MQMIITAARRHSSGKVANSAGDGKEYRKARAVLGAGSTTQADRAAMLGDDAVADPQSQPGALFSLSRVKRTKQIGLGFGVDPPPIISHYDADAALARVFPIC